MLGANGEDEELDQKIQIILWLVILPSKHQNIKQYLVKRQIDLDQILL